MSFHFEIKITFQLEINKMNNFPYDSKVKDIYQQRQIETEANLNFTFFLFQFLNSQNKQLWSITYHNTYRNKERVYQLPCHRH